MLRLSKNPIGVPMKKQLTSLCAISACFGLLLAGCKDGAQADENQNSDSSMNNSDTQITNAFAKINPTQGNKAHGKVTFIVVEEGVKVVADIDDVPPGKHGFHIHEKGDCSAPDASSAGGHFDPTKKQHGSPDSADRHVGDLGNAVADAKGHVHYERIDKVIKLNGPESIIGRAVILHEKEDDFKTQPTGNAGSRIGCGVIVEDTDEIEDNLLP